RVGVVGGRGCVSWALATGLARRVMEVLAPPIQTDIVEEKKLEKEPPPPPPPEFEKPPAAAAAALSPVFSPPRCRSGSAARSLPSRGARAPSRAPTRGTRARR